MKRPPQRRADLNWGRLQISTHNLDMLADDFTELRSAINHMPTDKAPRPDDFTVFFQRMLGYYQRGRNERS